VFGKKEFRGQQEAVMKAAVKGLDIMVIGMVDESSKSITYHLTLVHQPLLD